MKKPSIGWQSWSPPFKVWHGLPRWDYSPFPHRPIQFPKSKKNINTSIRYWCSWYAYGWDIDDKKINHTLEIIKKFKLPFTHILIDDGWTKWGDWHFPDLNRFPSISTTIKKIRQSKLQAGLWFAPFLANRKSNLFKNHPDWFVYHKGRPIQGLKTLPIWESLLPQQYLLNFEVPEVRKYITDFIDIAVKKWGVSLLKLDFLYAPYFDHGHHDDQIAHNQVDWLLTYIKTHHPKVTTIACGAPFASSIGSADIIRISKDTALPPISPHFFNKFVYESRVKMLKHKLDAFDFPKNLRIDPDVRLFKFNSSKTHTIWNEIPRDVLGIGDNLSSLSEITLNKIKLWLSQ